MARTVITLNKPIFKLADSEAALTAGDAYECQLTSATIVANPNFNTIPATGCAGATQSPGTTGWQLDLNWLQDWTAPGGGLSGFAYTHDTEPKWFSFTLNKDDPTVVATGEVFVVAGGYGGTFGDGTPAAASATWPCLDKPDITLPADTVTAEATQPEAEPAGV